MINYGGLIYNPNFQQKNKTKQKTITQSWGVFTLRISLKKMNEIKVFTPQFAMPTLSLDNVEQKVQTKQKA